MKTLKLTRDVYEQLIKSAENEFPLEACGLLAGKNAQVESFYPVTNAEKSSTRYFMEPGEQFQAYKQLRREGLEVVGIWHSHPFTPPRLSEEDYRMAYMPGVIYVILSLAPGFERQLRAFKRMQEGNFEEQEIEIVDRREAHWN